MRPYLKKNPLKKKGWWSGSRSEALSSNPVLQKKKRSQVWFWRNYTWVATIWKVAIDKRSHVDSPLSGLVPDPRT
jgi:hypothetical protein